MSAFSGFRGRLGLGLLVSLLATAPLVADPGDGAAGQNDYKSIRNGAQSLQEAKAVLKDAANMFGGHKAKAIDAINTALEELDAAVNFANANGGAGEKGESRFDPAHGATAAS